MFWKFFTGRTVGKSELSSIIHQSDANAEKEEKDRGKKGKNKTTYGTSNATVLTIGEL